MISQCKPLVICYNHVLPIISSVYDYIRVDGRLVIRLSLCKPLNKESLSASMRGRRGVLPL